jgi:hypothetical protein
MEPATTLNHREAFLEAKKAADRAKAGLLARLETIKAEKKAAFAKWNAETKEIHELLRVKAKFTRKPKPAERADAA